MKKIVAALAAAMLGCSHHASAETPACRAFPAFPDATCTGPTGTLTPYSGTQEFRTGGQVIENVEIQTSTGIYLPASNVTFRNVRIIYTGALDGIFTVINNQGQNNVFQNVEIDGGNNVYRAVYSVGTGTGITVRNCNFHDIGKALEVAGPIDIEDNYFHDIKTPVGADWHADGIQAPSTTGASKNNLKISHNTIILTGTSGATGAINIHGEVTDPATNVDIENNLFAGGSYTMYTQYGDNYQVNNNHFSTRIFPNVGRHGIWYPGQQGIVRQGNVIDETGASANS